MGVRRGFVVIAAAVALVTGACGSDDDAASSTTTEAPAADVTTTTGESATTSAPAPEGETLRILVGNDDGVGAPGIDVLVEALRKLPDTEIVVVAPKDNQSGTGSNRTEGGVEVVDATTLSGYPAKSVAGFPYDTMVWALDEGGVAERPHLVVTGVNQGANIGPLVDISGTIGAARAAAQRGIPALASSQGIATEPDYASGADLVVEWIGEHRDALLAGTETVQVTSLNIPTCPVGAIRGVVTVPVAADAGGRELFTSNCESTSPEPADDIDGFSNGYATSSVVPTTPAAGG